MPPVAMVIKHTVGMGEQKTAWKIMEATHKVTSIIYDFSGDVYSNSAKKIDTLHPTKLDLIYFSIFNYLNQ